MQSTGSRCLHGTNRSCRDIFHEVRNEKNSSSFSPFFEEITFLIFDTRKKHPHFLISDSSRFPFIGGSLSNRDKFLFNAPSNLPTHLNYKLFKSSRWRNFALFILGIYFRRQHLSAIRFGKLPRIFWYVVMKSR